MLQKISDRIQGWVAGIIIAIIALVFGLWGIEYYVGRGANGSPPVATVNGHKITEKNLNSLYRQLLQRISAAQPNKSLSVGQQNEVKSLALQQLISKVALVDAAKKAGFGVSKEQVQQIVMQAPEFQVKGLFSPQRFQQFLFAIQSTEAQFVAQLQGNFIMNQVSIGLETSAFLLPNELQRAYELMYQRRSFGYFVLPLSKFLSGITVTQEEIQSYYEKNKKAYRTPEKVQVSYLLLSPEAIEKEITISLAELKAYYEGNKASYKKPFAEVKNQIENRLKRQKAQQILSQKSDTLSNLAYTNPNTLTVASKKLGLSIKTSPWLTKQGLKKGLFANHSVVTVAFSNDVLQEGNNSNPIDLKNGAVMVLRVIKHEPSKIQPLSAVKTTIETVIKKNKGESKAGLEAYTVSSALGSGATPQALAKRYGLTWVLKQSVKRDDKGTPMPILISAFSTVPVNKGNPGTNTLVMANGNYVVLKVKSVQLADFLKAPAKTLTALNNQLTRLKGEMEYRLYGKSVINRAKITLHHLKDADNL